MQKHTLFILILAIHLIGAIITLFIYCKNGTMEDAAKHGDGIRWATPSDVVYMAFVFWEFNLFLFLFFMLPESLINNYFRNKYEGVK